LIDRVVVGHHQADERLVSARPRRNSALAADRTVRTSHPVPAEALLAGASGQLLVVDVMDV
jgi:hypothetical protein